MAFSKIARVAAFFLLAAALPEYHLMADGQFLDEHGHLKGTIQKNGDNGYLILDEHGYAEAYIQENGDNGYMILDSEGHAKGFYQED